MKAFGSGDHVLADRVFAGRLDRMIRIDRPTQLRRRQVLRIATVGALGVLAAEVAGVLLTFVGTRPAVFGGRTAAVGRRTDLLDRFRESGDRPIHVQDEMEGLYLLHAPGGIIAARQMCTHLQCRDIVFREDLRVLDCRCHSAMFDMRTGLIRGGPAPRPLDLFHLREEGGVVVVDPDPSRLLVRRENVWDPGHIEVRD